MFDHATPIGELVTASPTLYRVEAEFHGKSAHAGLRPEEGRSAILAAAHAAIAMPHGRIDDQTTANIGYLHGGVESTNVVPERARVFAEVRSVDPDTAEEVLAAMIDALHDGASHGECDVDVITEKQVVGYRVKPSSPAVVGRRGRAARPRLRAASGSPPAAPRTPTSSRPPASRRSTSPTAPSTTTSRPSASRSPRWTRCSTWPSPSSTKRRWHELRTSSASAPRRIFDGKFFAVRRDTFRHEDGEVVERELVTPPGRRRRRRPRRQDQLWFVRQPREAIGVPDLLEIPAGKLDVEGEDPLEAAKPRARRGDRQAGRPLGLARLLLHLRRASPTRSIHLFLATGISDVDERPEVEENERIDIEVRPLTDLDAILAETRTPRP